MAMSLRSNSIYKDIAWLIASYAISTVLGVNSLEKTILF